MSDRACLALLTLPTGDVLTLHGLPGLPCPSVACATSIGDASRAQVSAKATCRSTAGRPFKQTPGPAEIREPNIPSRDVSADGGGTHADEERA